MRRSYTITYFSTHDRLQSVSISAGGLSEAMTIFRRNFPDCRIVDMKIHRN